jgi:hypothetical protein
VRCLLRTYGYGSNLVTSAMKKMQNRSSTIIMVNRGLTGGREWSVHWE